MKTQSSITKQLKVVSSIIYRGPSLIDGKPIVCIAIKGSKNAKTGGVLQSYILADNGMSPLENSKTGNDVSICGGCIHRGKPTDNPSKKQAEERSCYVNLGQGPTIVYKALQRGVYPMASPDEIKRLGAGSVVRIGTYGDGAAVPREVWDMLIQDAMGHTGYTHNLKHQPNMAELCMVSADSQQQAANAKSHQRRTFRVIPVATWEQRGIKSVMKNEILCPASKEMDYKTTCDKCKLCNGSTGKGKSIAIVAHGASKNYIKG